MLPKLIMLCCDDKKFLTPTEMLQTATDWTKMIVHQSRLAQKGKRPTRIFVCATDRELQDYVKVVTRFLEKISVETAIVLTPQIEPPTFFHLSHSAAPLFAARTGAFERYAASGVNLIATISTPTQANEYLAYLYSRGYIPRCPALGNVRRVTAISVDPQDRSIAQSGQFIAQPQNLKTVISRPPLR